MTYKMQYRVVWRRFNWQKFGRLWLYYYHPGMGEWRHANLSKFFSVYNNVVFAAGQNDMFKQLNRKIGKV